MSWSYEEKRGEERKVNDMSFSSDSLMSECKVVVLKKVERGD